MALDKTSPNMRVSGGQPHGLTKYDELVRQNLTRESARSIPLPQNFGRLGHRNPLTGAAPDGAPFDASRVIKAITIALDAMEDTGDLKSDAAAGMTFLGQFIDHDVTLDAQSAIGTRVDPRTITNLRTPTLDLDCVYGSGPEATPHLYHPDHEGFLLFGNAGNALDLARNSHGTALIGDPRNDENQVVSQLQGAFICLHNILMTALQKDDGLITAALSGIRSQAIDQGIKPGEMAFQAARRIVRHHYQWLVVNDFLPTFVDAGVLKAVKHKLAHGHLPDPFQPDSPVMPVEFSGAAYRFGHATVQNGYRLNAESGVVPLFEMSRREFSFRDTAKNIDFSLFFDMPGKPAAQKARPVGRKLASSIFNLPFIHAGLSIDGNDLPVSEARKLPHRNVFRDRFALELNSGQQMARKVGTPEIPAPVELAEAGISKTPLWYYCLQEAEHFGGKLGPVGGTIVATTLLRVLYLDPDSIVTSGDGFVPWAALGAKSGTYSMGHMLHCVEAKRDSIAHRNDLITG